MKSNALKTIYLAFMIIGSFFPMFLALPHLRTYGFSPYVFLQHANSTSAAAACFADIALSAVVFLIFAWSDLKKRDGPQRDFWITLLLIPIGLITSIAFYLYRREQMVKTAI